MPLILTLLLFTLTMPLKGANPLLDAGKARDVTRIRALITGDTHALWKDDYTFHSAAQAGYAELVHELIQAGAPLEARNHIGQSALHCAALMGNTTIVKELYAYNANLEAMDSTGATPLHSAVFNHRNNVRDYKSNSATIRFLLCMGANVSAERLDGIIPLCYAAELEKPELVWMLITAGSEIDRPEGHSPLFCAMKRVMQWPSWYGSGKACVELLLGIGALLPALDDFHAVAENHNEPRSFRSYYTRCALPLAQRWAWELQQALQTRMQGTTQELPDVLVQLICTFATNVIPYNNGTPIRFLSNQYAQQNPT